MSGFSDHFKDQIEALKTAVDCALSKIPGSAWTFGGGTALAMFYFEHRLSYDVDIFIHDPQYFAFLSPKWYIDDAPDIQDDYLELAHHISLTSTRSVKIDFLLTPYLTDEPPILKRFSGIECRVDPTVEIIAKKLRYRLKDLRPRDVFDVAVAVDQDAPVLKKIVDQGAITWDELFEWAGLLGAMDIDRYRSQIRVLSPRERFTSLAMDAPGRLLRNIESLKKSEMNRL
ncbi:MAG: nucleotidyl transferase AbiEii/AbiGii toxin family protein [Thermodesulfobacteriota bacterium]